MHLCIENGQKAKTIYVPIQWLTLISCLLEQVTGKPYTVIEISNEDFLDFKPLVDDKLSNWKTGRDGSNIKWNTIREIVVTFEKPFELYIKYDSSASDFVEINITLKKNIKENINFVVNQ